MSDQVLDIATGDTVLIRLNYADDADKNILARYASGTDTWVDVETGLACWVEGTVKSCGVLGGSAALELDVIDPFEGDEGIEVIQTKDIAVVINFSRG